MSETRCPAHPTTAYSCERMGLAPNCRFCGRSMLEGRRDGETMEAEAILRLNAQMQRVYDALADGRWHLPNELEAVTGDNWASISARARDLRKTAHGGYEVQRESRGGGLFAYRLVMEGQ